MNERTWEGYYGKRPSRSVIPAHESQRHLPDPNNEWDQHAIRYWVKFSDFYEMPYIRYYNSTNDLVTQLTSVTDAELLKTSQQMRAHNQVVKEQLVSKWKDLLARIIQRSPKSNPAWNTLCSRWLWIFRYFATLEILIDIRHWTACGLWLLLFSNIIELWPFVCSHAVNDCQLTPLAQVNIIRSYG